MATYREILNNITETVPSHFIAKFHSCVSTHDTKSVRIFLNSPLVSTFINCRGTNGDTAIIIASRKGYDEIAYLLVEAGCEDTINNYGERAMNVPKTGRILAFLEKAGFRCA